MVLEASLGSGTTAQSGDVFRGKRITMLASDLTSTTIVPDAAVENTASGRDSSSSQLTFFAPH